MNIKGRGSHPGVTRWDQVTPGCRPRPWQGQQGASPGGCTEAFVVQSEEVVFRLEAGVLQAHWHSSTQAAFLNWWFLTQRLAAELF